MESENSKSEEITAVEESVEPRPSLEITKAVVEQSPYAYLNRDFSSENFKIEVKNMPRFYGFNVGSIYCNLYLIILIFQYILGVS